MSLSFVVVFRIRCVGFLRSCGRGGFKVFFLAFFFMMVFSFVKYDYFDIYLDFEEAIIGWVWIICIYCELEWIKILFFVSFYFNGILCFLYWC